MSLITAIAGHNDMNIVKDDFSSTESIVLLSLILGVNSSARFIVSMLWKDVNFD